MKKALGKGLSEVRVNKKQIAAFYIISDECIR